MPREGWGYRTLSRVAGFLSAPLVVGHRHYDSDAVSPAPEEYFLRGSKALEREIRPLANDEPTLRNEEGIIDVIAKPSWVRVEIWIILSDGSAGNVPEDFRRYACGHAQRRISSALEFNCTSIILIRLLFWGCYPPMTWTLRLFWAQCCARIPQLRSAQLQALILALGNGCPSLVRSQLMTSRGRSWG